MKTILILTLLAYFIFVVVVIYLIFKAYKKDEDQCKIEGKAEKSLLDND